MAFADVWLAAVRGSNCKISRGLSYSVLVLANSLNCRDARGTRQINRGICQLSNPGIPYSGRSQEAIRRLGTYKQFKWDPSLNVGLHNHYTPARLYASPRRKDQLVESSDKGAVSTTTEKGAQPLWYTAVSVSRSPFKYPIRRIIVRSLEVHYQGNLLRTWPQKLTVFVGQCRHLPIFTIGEVIYHLLQNARS